MDFQTGDILLFSDHNWWFNKLIECCSDSRYCHVALVIRDPKFTHPPMEGIYMLESSMGVARDVEDGSEKIGVRFRKLVPILEKLQGRAWVRHIHCERDDEFYKKLAYAYSKFHNKPYDEDPIDWIDCLFNAGIGDVQKTDRFICSALCAFVLTCVGLMPRETPWSKIRPKDFGTESGHRDDVIFINCQIENEKKI